jgi:FKBP-type peptidyl-prolyl cis-trans isomerase
VQNKKFMQDICGDGGLLKQVLREGTGESFPPNGAEVQVHYVGKLQDGTVFDSSRDRNQPFSFKLGQSSVIKGWDKGVATMRKGELSILRCAPNYAYGAEGSPPKIPPNSTLDFEVEVLDWDSYTKVVDGVKKCVLVEGEGYAKPTDRSSAIISYTICVDGANVFQSPVDYKFVIGSDLEVIEALDECVKSMKKGEKAHFLVKANLAFGETGSESLRVKPNTDVEIQIHLADFQKGRERWEMDTKEKFECAVQEKERGNALYKANKLDRSFRKYKAALDFVQYESNITEADVQKIADDLKYSCNSNIAAVKLKQKEYKDLMMLKFYSDELRLIMQWDPLKML